MNLFELFAKISVDDQASSHVEKLSSKLGNGLKTAAKIGTAAVSAAAAGIAALTKASVENYAEYEQLVGGVETLFNKTGLGLEEYAKSIGKTAEEAFGEWSKLTAGASIVQNNADKAFKSAGLSANEYMSTVTSFSASLIASLDGDTVAAAKAADRAITDMADNANKMGTSMEMIQNAYQGFAKQNYTMLDNLKLGYGGTKTEMERLIEDASKMTDVQKELNLTVDAGDMSFGNIVNAISVMQSKMGIAGATAKEAATTISGSLGMLKASWQNVLTALSDDDADGDHMLYTYIQDLVDSAATAFNNLFPVAQQALVGISELISELAPVVVEKLPALIADFLPKLTDAAIGIVETILTSVVDNKETLIETAFTVITTIANGMLDMLPQILLLGIDLILSLAEGITSNLDTILPALMQTIMKIVEVLTNEENLAKFLDVALTLITELAFGLMENIDELIDAVFSIIDGIVMFLLKPESLEKLITTAIELVVAIGTGLIQAIPQLIISVLSLISSIDEQFENTDWAAIGDNVIHGVLDGLKRAWESVKSWFSNAWDSLFGNNELNVDVRRRTVPDGSHRTGLDYVPYDGYIAELHKGERVLTAQEAKGYKGNTIPITNNFYGGYTERDGAKIARSINRQLGLLV